MSSGKEIMSSRVLFTKRETAFEAFSDPKQLAKWWGPKGFTNTIEVFEFKPGGNWKLVMHSPSGADYPNESIFTEVVPPVRFVYYPHHE